MKKLIIFYAGFVSRGGGVVTHAKNIKKVFEEKGYTVDIWSLDNVNLIGYFLVGIERLGDFLFPPVGKYLRSKLTKSLLDPIVDKHVKQCDYVIFEEPYSFSLKYKNLKPVIYFIHGARSNYLGDLKFTIPFLKNILIDYERNCLKELGNKGAFILKEQKSFLEKKYQIKFACQVINNTLNLNILNIKDELLPWKDRKYITLIGLLNKVKNPDFFIEVARCYKQTNDNRYKFIIIGEGSLKGELQKRVEKYNLDELVVFTGILSHKEVFKYLSNTKYLLVPSFSEGLPFVLIEGKLMGCYNIINEDLPIPQEFYDSKLKLESELWVQEILKDQAPQRIAEDDLKEQFSADKHYKEILDALNQR